MTRDVERRKSLGKCIIVIASGVSDFGTKLGHIGIKWDKNLGLSNISFQNESKCTEKLIFKNPRLVQIDANLA